MKRMQILSALALFALLASACSREPDPFCGAVETIIAASAEPVPFAGLAKGLSESQLTTGFPPPAGLSGAAGCMLGSGRDFHTFECLWLGQGDAAEPETSKVADKVEACLVTKGWSKTVAQGSEGVQARKFAHVGQRASVSVIYTGLGGLQRDSLMVQSPVN